MEGQAIIFSFIKTILLISLLLSENNFCESYTVFQRPPRSCITAKNNTSDAKRIDVQQVLPQLLNFQNPLISEVIAKRIDLDHIHKKIQILSRNFLSLRPKEIQFILGAYGTIGILSASSFTYSSFDLKKQSWRIFQDTDGGMIAPLSELVGVSSLVDLDGEQYHGLRLSCGPLLWYHNLNDQGKYAYLRLSYDWKLPMLPLFFKLGCRLTFK